MSREGRDRTRTTAPRVGYYKSLTDGSLDVQVDNVQPIQHRFMHDQVGSPTTDSNLQASFVDRTGIIPFDGSVQTLFAGRIYETEVRQYNCFEDEPSHLSTLLPSEDEALTHAIARSNPSRPSVTPLTLLQDVVEIPRMLKDVGRLARAKPNSLRGKDLANHFLGAKFGWLPLIRDVHDLLNLQSAIDKRHGELNRLYSSKGLRRSISSGSDTQTENYRENAASIGHGTVFYKMQRITTGRRWATVRWTPVTVPRWSQTDAGRIRQARKLASGLTTEGVLSGAWELLPWSFIVDWFSNAGDFMKLWSNTVPAVSSSYCVMTHETTTDSYSVTGWSTRDPFSQDIAQALSGGGGSITYETKRRSVMVGPSFGAHIPNMGIDRLSTLGALFVQRFK